MKLKNKKLLKDKAYIDGVWVDGPARYDVTNPADGEVIGCAPDLGAGETRAAIAAAEKAFPAWAKKTAKERAAILRRWYELIVEHVDDLAVILTTEQGKPLAEAKGEILYGASFVEWFAEEGKRVYGDLIPSPVAGARISVLRQPVGVSAAITPWNFPSAMITRKVAPALAAGCTIVCKPAGNTPFSALALAVLADEAGFPAGVFNVITSDDPAPIGRELCENPAVRKLSFTGSTAVGRLLMRQCADTIKKLSLELGGNAPFIVFDDADIEQAVDGAMACKFRNAGQTCVCANRIYVQDTVYDEFARKLAVKIKALKVGDGLEEGTDIGPMIDEKGMEKVQDHIADALEHGAELVTGGQPHEAGEFFFEPTLLGGMTKEMKIAREETFGPVAPLFRFSDEAEVIDLANDTIYGLAAYFYSKDMARVIRVSEALEYGMVAVNKPILSTEVAPFGGIKQSGLGREGSKYGIDEYLEMKYVLMGGLK
ncbi:MAG TPA: NAD-dependent succinate-semialdehyde dehydrogenase [Alphaproteobacteria bacterium]|nr:NAD-dependent succinate-semialdehyde dehydrogenase [Alphaproteobacteria bacterium]USO06098.1 MAG: NAD-dependent succinate-semialdehyde dehydrogenase [Rhodospirillales bacterium]HOO82810.1 NAD-dependent succinate-semialdehyde dehydrogenase [Alphaproteobacteria bacterium]